MRGGFCSKTASRQDILLAVDGLMRTPLAEHRARAALLAGKAGVAYW